MIEEEKDFDGSNVYHHKPVEESDLRASVRHSIQSSSDFDDEMFVKMTGLTSLKENNLERKLQLEHPSLAKTNLKVADFFQEETVKDKLSSEAGISTVVDTPKDNLLTKIRRFD